MTVASATAGPREDPPRYLRHLGHEIDRRIVGLQREYLHDGSTARAQLARLRRALGKPTGSVPDVWQLTMLSGSLAGTDTRASRAERAAHAALTLYALHQQSVRTPMHVPGVTFGAAVRRLCTEQTKQAVTRRFMAVATAGSIDEVLVHVRGLVTQLRSQSRGFDYARFADDLHALLTPGRAQAVRLAWGRAFYRTDGIDSNNDEKITESGD